MMNHMFYRCLRARLLFVYQRVYT